MENVIEEINKDIKEEEIIEKADKKKKKVTKKIEKKGKKLIDNISEAVEEEIEKGDEIIEENFEENLLEKAAEKESLDTKKSLKKKEILERAKKLAEKIHVTKTEELKEQIKLKKKKDMLIPLEEYVKAGIYLGTKVVTPIMKQYVYRRRADGLAILNTDTIDEKLREGIEYISKFEPKEIIVVCKRQAGWKVVEMFSKITGIRAFTKKYPAGILTNTKLPEFFETELTIVCDSWLDKNALTDTKNIKKKVLMVCDTNNFSQGIDKVIIGNNKSPKSLGIIFYLLTKGYCEAKGIKADIPDLEWWISGEEEQNL